MSKIDIILQNDLNDLIRSISGDMSIDCVREFVSNSLTGMLRYQTEIGSICDYAVDIDVINHSVTVSYKTSSTAPFKDISAALPTSSQPASSVGANSGTIHAGGSNTTIYNGGAGHGNYTISVTPTNPLAVTSSQVKSNSSKLPSIAFEETDDAGVIIKMTLQPDWQAATTTDSLKISMMLFAAISMPKSFSTHAYVKANQLERHFSFKPV